MKAIDPRPFRRRLIRIAVASCFATAAYGNPTGPSVVSGAATFNAVGKNLTITNSPGAIINWQGFSIRADEVTRFVQSGAASAILNRVTGAEPSQLLGQLLSNGRVFLINPNGVTIGAGSVIDTAGFVASSLNLSNEDFLAGKFRFTDPGNAGRVVNAGTINAHSGGLVYLVAPTVENHGVITAPNGDVMLAAGKSVELVAAASPDLRVRVKAGGEALNLGRLVAESGRVGIYGAAVRNAGLVSADSAELTATGTVILKASKDVTLDSTSAVTANGPKGGLITVQAEDGTLLADGKIEAKGSAAGGGDVRLLGTQVGLVRAAGVDASGATGGGQVLVGGDYRGGNRGVQNAARTVLAPDARIAADATERGDGGRVILWSDEYTGFYGTVSARGGAQSGNGGFVETSSKDNLQAFGTVAAAAPNGRAGEWLLDPSNVTISGGGTANGAYSGGSPNIFTTTANNAVANVGTIQTSLNAGTSVTITTAPGGTQAGNITVASAITKSAGGAATLTLDATNGIGFNAGSNITSTTGALNVTLNANGAGGITNLRNVDTNGGTLTLNSPGAVSQAAGSTIQGATAVVKQGTGTTTLSQANTYTGATSVQAGTLTVSNASGLGTAAGGTTVGAGATLALSGALTWTEPVTLAGGTLSRAANNPTLSGPVSLAADSVLTGAGGTLTLSGVVSGAGGLTKTGAGTVVLSGANTYAGATNVNAGTLTLGANDVLPDTTAVTVAAGATFSVNTRTDTVASISGAGGIATAAGGVLTSGASGASTSYSGAMSGAGGLTKIGPGTLTLSGGNTFTGATTISGGTLLYGASNALAGGAVVVNDGGTYNLNGFSDTIGALTVNSGVTGGTVTTGAGTLTLGGNVTSTGGAANAAISGNLSLGGATRTFTTTNAADGLTVAAVVSGTAAGAGLTKAGAGTLTLSAANTYTGTTTINGGTLRYGANNALATGAVVVNNGGTYDLNGFSDTIGALTVNSGATGGTVTTGAGTLTLGGNVSSTGGAANASISGNLDLGGATRTFTTTNAADGLAVSAVISGAAGLTKAGNGTLTLSAANTYTGATAINAGTLAATNASSLGTTGGATTVANNAALNVVGVTIGETLTINGGGVGATGALRGTGTAGVTGPVTLATNSSIGADAGATLAVSGAIGQSGGNRTLTKVGTGTLVLSGANSYAGATTVSAGTLTAASAGALGATGAGTTVAAGATLDIDNAAIPAEAITLNGTLAGTGTASLAGGVALGAASSITTATLADTLTVTGAVTGAAANPLNKNGAGTLVLGGAAANTYAGVTNVNAGTLVAAKASALGATGNGTTVADGATVRIANVAIGAEAVTLNGAGVGGAGALQGTGAASLTGNVALASAAAVGAPAAADTLTLSGVVSGPNDLTKVGAGMVVLAGAGANTYGGATNVDAGTLRVGSAANKITDGSAVTVAAGATLDLNNFSETVGSIAGAGNVALGTATLTAGGNGATTTFSGVVSGAGGLTKQGAGTLTLSGANTYGGVTNVAAGTLAAANASALGGTANGTTVQSGATLNVNSVAIGAENVTISGNGVGGAGALTGTGTASLGGAVSVASASRVGAAAGNALALNGAVDGANALDVAGGGTVALGSTVGNTTPLAALTSAAGTTLNVNGGLVRTTGTQTYGGPMNVGAPATLQTTNSAISANGAVTATAGTLTLSTGSGSVTMTDAGNDFATVAIPGAGTVSLVDQNALALGASSVGTLQAQTLAGDLTLGGAVTATGGGNSIVLAAGDNFVNNAGAGALNPGAGRWLVYSTDPAANTFGGLASGNQALWGRAYPAAVPEAGNRYLFTTQPAITFTSTDVAKTYGQDATAAVAAAYAVSGFVNAALYGNVFTQDTAANALTGAPAVTSLGSPANAPVAGSPYAISVNTAGVTSPTGYAIAGNSAGQLTIGPAALAVTANNQTKTYGQTFVFNGTEFSSVGLQNGETIGTVALASAGAAPTATVPGGPYAITASNAAGGTFNPGNYAITYNDGVMTVTPLPITVTANNQAKVYGQPDPTLTFTAPTVNGDVLAGTPVRTPGETVAASPYAIIQGTVTNSNNPNYSITFVNGQLVITPAPLTIAADNKARLYGDANPPLTAAFTGLANGDTSAAIPGVTLTTPAVPGSNAGNYTINVGSGANANYTITYVNGQLAITRAPLEIAADDKARAFAAPNPPFTATSTGFKLGQTVADLNGTLVFATPATPTSPPAVYPITPGGVSSANYTITFVDGVLVVGQGAPPSSDQPLVTAVGRSVTDPTVGVAAQRTIDCLTVERPGERRVLGRCF